MVNDLPFMAMRACFLPLTLNNAICDKSDQSDES
jgi:hypothetical protein